MRLFCRILFISFILMSLVACAQKTPIQGYVEDISNLPQDLFAYIPEKDLHTPLLSDEEHRKANARAIKLFFRPWHIRNASVSKKDAYMMIGTNPLTARPRGTTSNLLPWTDTAWKALVENAAPDLYPSMMQRVMKEGVLKQVAMTKHAISIRPTSLRGAPTLRPRFGNPARAGQGYPFDLFQTTTIPLGMPLLVTHQSQDGAWYYIETALASGWIQANDMAFVDDALRKTYEAKALVVVSDDYVSFFDASGIFLTQGHMGTLLPKAPIAKGHATGMVLTQGAMNSHAAFEVLIPMRKPDGFATLIKSHVSVTQADMLPALLTPYTLAKLGMRVMARPYGWGGLNEDRDCSSLLRDIFLVSGVWLPRNSAAQAKAWKYISFKDTGSEAKKEQIKQEGRPFATLLWLPGHIALYIGEYNGEPVMFHSMWGLRTFENKREGRHVIGRVVITSTQPGLNLPNRVKSRSLLKVMRGMSVL